MAHQGLTQRLAALSKLRVILGLLASGLVHCASTPPQAEAPRAPSAFFSDPHPRSFHSARFELAVPLPDGHGWRIDDHRTPLLVATHAATASKLTLGIFSLPELTSRQRCEAAARDRGLVPRDPLLHTLEEAVTVGPGAYDSRVLVALEPGTSPAAVTGHVFLFGGFIRKCLFVHFATGVAPGEDEATLSTKLAIARLQILGGIVVDAFDKPKRELEAPREERPPSR